MDSQNKGAKAPSLTFWLLSRPFAWIRDAVLVWKGIFKGTIPLPGWLFYAKFAAYSVGLLAVIGAYIASPVKLMYNHTPSEPIGWYIVKDVAPDEPLELGQLVAFRYECPKTPNGDCIYGDEVPFTEGHKLLKRVQGMPGHTVSTVAKGDGYHNLISGSGYEKDTGAIRETTSSGEDLQTVFEPGASVIIPDGKLYMGNQNLPNAFDSRYFGFVDRNRIIGVAEKL